MSQIKYINPVSPSSSKRNYPTQSLNTPESLESKLRMMGLDITLGEALKGGTVSQVYEAELDSTSVVVKHTGDVIPFDPTELLISKEGHNVDSNILSLLSQSNQIQVPKIIHHFADITTTIMEDVRQTGFSLFSSKLELGELPMQAAETIARNLAYFSQESQEWRDLITNESQYESIYERGLELRLAYPNTQTQYLELKNEFVKDTGGYVWSDCHPKNIFIKNDKVILIDFGRIHKGDQRYMLPNFLSHIALFALAGFYPIDESVRFIRKSIVEYTKLQKIDEKIFCKYFGMEILHRANGKWLSRIDTSEQKVALYSFGLSIFDKKITTIESLLSELKEC